MLSDFALPLIKTLPAEAAHSATIKSLKLKVGLPKISPGQWQTGLRLNNSGLELPNPVGLAAGFDKNAEVHAQMARFGFGFIECGTVTPKPQPGNPKPRVFRLVADQAVINRLGFNNHGLDYFVRRLRRKPVSAQYKLGANVGANKSSEDFMGDYEVGMARVAPFADYITINISSPNTPGLRDLQGTGALEELLERCGSIAQLPGSTGGATMPPVFLKLAPDLIPQQIQAIIDALTAKGTWLSGLIISNTTVDRPSDLCAPEAGQSGGLSGAPLMQKSTAVLKEMAGALAGRFDLIGCGGIGSGADAYQKIRAGASAVQVYTALMYQGAGLVSRINADLAARLKADGFTTVAEAVGADLS